MSSNTNYGCGDCFDPTTIVLNEGEDGADGLFGGYSASWSFDTNTSTSPASTRLRFNNNTLNLVNEIYLADNNIGSVDHSAFITSMNPFGKYGFIKVFKATDSNVFWLGKITTITDNTTYFTLTVTHIFSNGSFTNNTPIVVSFTPIATTSVLLSNTFSIGNINSLAYSTIGTYTLPAGTLVTNGNNIKLKAILRFVNITTASCKYRIRINGNNISATLTDFDVTGPDTARAFIEIDFNRVSNTSGFVELKNRTQDLFYGLHMDQGTYESIGSLNFTTTDVVFTVEGIVGAATEYIYLDQLEVIQY